MKFIVIQKQKGEGCDYTIGCGMRYDIIEAESIKDCIDILAYPDGIDEYCHFNDTEAPIVEAWVIPLQCAHKVDVDKIIERDTSRQLEDAESDKESQERVKYNRLKQKYGNKS